MLPVFQSNTFLPVILVFGGNQCWRWSDIDLAICILIQIQNVIPAKVFLYRILEG